MADCQLFVVTGANGGLGSQIVLDLSRNFPKERIIATTRSELRSSLAALPNVITASGLDLSSPTGSERLSQFVNDHTTDRMYLLHCAGAFSKPDLLAGMNLHTVRQAFDSNALSFAGSLKSLLPHMRAKRFGRVLAYTTHTLAYNAPYLGAFDASKHALESLVKTAANEGARYGIAVNGLPLATLALPAEREMKPNADHNSWLSLQDVSCISREVLQLSHLINGNIIHCWRHSDSFFGTSFLERNSLDPAY